MDPFTEKQLIEALNLISGTLMGIKAELADLNVAVREMNEIALDSNFSEDKNIDDEDDSKEIEVSKDSLGKEEEEKTDLEEADEGFVVAEDDTIVDADNSKLVPEDADEEKEENVGDSF